MEMQTTPRLARTIAAIAVAVAAASPIAAGARLGSAPTCATSALRLAVSDQGTSGGAFIGIHARAQARCVLAGRATLTILQAGRPARIVGNPLTVRLKGVVVPQESRLVGHAWWFGWCRSRKALSVVVHYRTLTVRGAPRYVPRCDSPSATSRLVAVR